MVDRDPGDRRRPRGEGGDGYWTTEVEEMSKLLLILLAGAVAAGVAAATVPDIRRYLEMRRM